MFFRKARGINRRSRWRFYKYYGSDIEITRGQFNAEVTRWKHKWSGKCDNQTVITQTPSSIQEYIYIYTYKNIYAVKKKYDIYNQRGRISSYPASPRRITVIVNFQAILLIFLGETSSNRNIFFTEDAAKNFFPTSKISAQEIRHQFFLIWSNLTIMAHIMGLRSQSESWKIIILS